MAGQIARLRDLQVSRYDLVLAVIPAVFVLAALAGTLLSLPPEAAVAAASLLGVVAMVDAMFLNPPVSRS